jgi:DUF4097 and DUF4098 domain-containing protein YvlB
VSSKDRLQLKGEHSLKQAIKLASIGIAIITTLASLALCQEPRVYREGSNWVQEMTGNLGAAKNLRVKLGAGSVKVQGGSQSGITYIIHRRAYTSSEEQARRQFESYRVSAVVKGDTAWIVAEAGGRDSKCADDLVVNVPRSLESSKIETGGGSLSANGIAGRVDLASGGGSIRVDDIGGDVSAETGGGGIDVGSVQGNVRVETGGGNIKVAAAKGQIKAESGGGNVVVLSGLQGAVLETGGGSIRVEKCIGAVKATTGGGSVDLGQLGGAAEIETGAGSIRLASAQGRVRAQTGGGSIELNGASSVQAETSAGGIVVKLLSSSGGARNDSTLETSAGDITVYLANDLPISVRAEIEVANGHTIRSDFSDIHVSSEGGPWEKTVKAEGQLNGGGPVLKVRTNSGNVNFRRVSR